MKIIPRYVLRHFIPVFSLSITAFTVLYVAVDFFERIDPMLSQKLPWQEIYAYFISKIPMILTQGIPTAALLAALITLGILKRNRELIAMETAGINPLSYVAPIAAAALVLSAVHFGVSEFLARPLNQRLENIWDVKVRQQKPAPWLNPENLWYREEHTIYQVRLFDRQKKTMEKASIFFLDPQFRLIQRLDALHIVWTEGGWIAENGLIVNFGTSTADTEQQWFEHRPVDLNVSPEDFTGREKLPEDLGWFDLYNYVERIEQEGFTSTPYRVDLHQRLAGPLATLILALLGVVVALRQGLHGEIAASVGISLGVAFAFLTVSSMGSSLASSGVLPAFLGVWAGNMIFFALICFNWIRRHA